MELEQLNAMNQAELEALFPKLDVSHIPNLQDYAWEEWHEGSLGAGDYFLADEMASKLNLRPGMRVLDLGSGRGYNSCFIAKHYGVEIYAVDAFTSPSEVLGVAVEKGVGDQVIPLQCDARQLPMANSFFDAALSLNAFFYFGTDDTYLPYLSQYMKPSASLCITSPCFSHEPNRKTPAFFMFDAPEFIEFYAMHSPRWWQRHVSKYQNMTPISCEEHRLGREIWLDSLRWQLYTRPKSDIIHDMYMLMQDTERFVTYFSLLVKFK